MVSLSLAEFLQQVAPSWVPLGHQRSGPRVARVPSYLEESGPSHVISLGRRVQLVGSGARHRLIMNFDKTRLNFRPQNSRNLLWFFCFCPRLNHSSPSLTLTTTQAHQDECKSTTRTPLTDHELTQFFIAPQVRGSSPRLPGFPATEACCSSSWKGQVVSERDALTPKKRSSNWTERLTTVYRCAASPRMTPRSLSTLPPPWATRLV